MSKFIIQIFFLIFQSFYLFIIIKITFDIPNFIQFLEIIKLIPNLLRLIYLNFQAFSFL